MHCLESYLLQHPVHLALLRLIWMELDPVEPRRLHECHLYLCTTKHINVSCYHSHCPDTLELLFTW